MCRRPGTRLLIDLPGVPLQSTALFASQEAGRTAPTGRLRLVGCDHCSAASNSAFVADLVPYDTAYENSQLFSPRFRAFAERLADDLIERFALEGRHVVEVGCGKGEFLALLCERGSLRGTGFDPTYDGEAEALTGTGTLTILPTWFDENAAGDPTDLVCCRHVLEHIDDPVSFLRRIRQPMQPDTALYLEVPNAAFTFTESGLWDLIYQHCIYFTGDALAGAVEAAGFDVVRRRSVFEDQFLALEAAATDRDDKPRNLRPAANAVATVDDFVVQAGRFTDVMDRWRGRLAHWRSSGRRVAMWGAGAKGVTFLNLVASDNEVETVVDVNPRKQGRHLAGTGHRVDVPTVLQQHRPDVVIVANQAYEAEIVGVLADLGVTAEIVAL